MSDTAKIVRSYFKRLGLRPEMAAIYLALQAHGPQTLSELARNSGVERIQIYRIMDDLKSSGLIEVEERYKRSLLHAAPISNVQLLLVKKEQELKELQQGYQTLTEQFKGLSAASKTTRVHFYQGTDGLKQMLWNQIKGKGVNRAILHNIIQGRVEPTFFERWAHACNDRHLSFKGIVGDHFIHAKHSWYMRHHHERLRYWEARYVSETTFQIPHSTVTYDDIVLHFSVKDEQVYGIEIHNPEIALVQRQLFDILWKQAAPIDDMTGRKL